jgi:Transposase DDE domain
MPRNKHHGMPFRHAVRPNAIQKAMSTYGIAHRKRIFDPQAIIWAWMSQIASADKSCRHAVSQVVAQYAVEGESISPRTGAYTLARQRLDIRVIRNLARNLARELEQECSGYQLIGRPAFAVDGTNVSCPDTPSITKKYIKQKSHCVAEGLGYPLIRLMLISFLTTGAIIDMVYSPFSGENTHEVALFARAWPRLQRGDVIVGDRAYSSSLNYYLLPMQSVDIVARKMTHLRLNKESMSKTLSSADYILNLQKPKKRPCWLTGLKHGRTPKTFPARYTSLKIRGTTGPSRLELLSSFIDSEVSKPQLEEFYRLRWNIETDIRSLKIDLGADILHCKSADMVEKELWMTVLTNNAVRYLAARAAMKHSREPRSVSFKGALQAINTFAPRFVHTPIGHEDHILSQMLDAMAASEVGNRPFRVEPRAVKRRQKNIVPLRTNRADARAACRTGRSR